MPNCILEVKLHVLSKAGHNVNVDSAMGLLCDIALVLLQSSTLANTDTEEKIGKR